MIGEPRLRAQLWPAPVYTASFFLGNPSPLSVPTTSSPGLPVGPVLRSFFSLWEHSANHIICLLKALGKFLVACRSRFKPLLALPPINSLYSLLAAIPSRFLHLNYLLSPQMEHSFCLQGWGESLFPVTLCGLTCSIHPMLSPWGHKESDTTERLTHLLLVFPEHPAESLQAGPLSFVWVSSASGRVPGT